MGITTKYPNGVSVGGGSGNNRSSVASVVASLRASFDPTSSTQVLLGTVPAGSRIIDVVSFGGGTGGTNPTVDIGTSGTSDAFANELRCDVVRSAVASTTAGTSIGTLLTAATPVYGKVGAAAATGGAVSVSIQYMVDDI